MEKITKDIQPEGKSAFNISDNDQQLGEMVFNIRDNQLTVYHTEVIPEAEGRGLAKKLLNELVAYARAEKLQVVPLCQYVAVQFKRHPADYQDLVS